MADKTLRVTAAQIEESVERLHNHSNFSILDSITSSRINEWDNKSNGEHTHTTDEIEGLDNLNVDLSNYYTKAEVTNKIAELSSKITTLETEVAELNSKLNPSTVEYMYYGRLSAVDLSVPPIIQYNQITEAHIKKGVADGVLTRTTPSTLGKTSMGLYNDTVEGDYIVVVVPKSKNYTVTKDNGIGGKAIWDEETAGANGIDITVDGVECTLWGEILLTQSEIFIYID